jgi:hypothetical protein
MHCLMNTDVGYGVIIACCFIFSAIVVGVPPVIYTRITKGYWPGNEPVACKSEWPDEAADGWQTLQSQPRKRS